METNRKPILKKLILSVSNSREGVSRVLKRGQGVVDPLQVRGEEVHPQAAWDGQEHSAEEVQRQEEQIRHTRPHAAAAADPTQTQTQQSHAGPGHR